MAVLSTNKGVMTGYEAFHLGLGGEHICNVY
jgi:ribosomal protein S8